MLCASFALVAEPTSKRRPHVVIIGGGFGGLYAAKTLRRADVDVTLVDRRNHHLFQPLLYQVATAGLAATDIASPIRKIIGRNPNTTVLLAEVLRIDPAQRRVELHGELPPLDYDALIVAAGVRHDYFGHPEWEKYAPGLKNLEDAMAIRSRTLLAFEHAEREVDPARKAAALTFVIVGAGPTGVEMAGAIAEIARQTLSGDFRRIDTRSSRVVLIEGGPRVLASYAPELSEKAKASLMDLGVEVRLGERVTLVDERGVQLGSGERINAETVVWAAGIAASPLGAQLGGETDRLGRVKVAPDLSVPAHTEIYAVGDLIAMEQDGQALPGVAQVAIQSGKLAAQNALARLQGRATTPFRYTDKGSLATIGRKRAIAQVGKLRLSGFLAWLLWLFVHILFLIGFKNRISVFINWAWAYFTFQRGARIVLTEGAKNDRP
ncbi:MAG: NAD(P)/FAD-dependent oxidoreductase [Myxococcales bacterium]|nr:NAD(P)/FAD-dependent oxidoreductase [Myxococcales bacterium]